MFQLFPGPFSLLPSGQIKRIIYKQAVDNNDSRMHEIAHKMLLNGTNPFSQPDIAEIVREMLNK
jgi:hypothetical protein